VDIEVMIAGRGVVLRLGCQRFLFLAASGVADDRSSRRTKLSRFWEYGISGKDIDEDRNMSRTEQQNTCCCAVSSLHFERRSGAVVAHGSEIR